MNKPENNGPGEKELARSEKPVYNHKRKKWAEPSHVFAVQGVYQAPMLAFGEDRPTISFSRQQLDLMETILEKIINRTTVSLEVGDLTKSRADAIVNAANPSLRGGGGVDGAIHRAGGPSILKACKNITAQIGRLEPGRAVITTGGRLPAKHVIHTVGPVWHGGDQREPEILASAYRESLALADKMALKTVAFPSISTGAYGYPLAPAVEIALRAVKTYLEGETFLERVTFVLFSKEIFEAYRAVLEKM